MKTRRDAATAAITAAVAVLLVGGTSSAQAALPLAVDLPTVVVAVIDSGVNGSVLPAAPSQEWTCTSTGCVPAAEPRRSDTDHGTSVAAVLTHLAPGVAYASYRVTTSHGLVSVPALRAAIAAAAAARVPVVNLSTVTFGRDPVIARTIRSHPDTLFVTAAGNQGRRIDRAHPVSPCVVDAPNVLCVAAATDAGTLWSGSNFSERYVALAAPAVRVPTYGGAFGQHHATGTSVATPAVSAAAARIVTETSCRSTAQVVEAITAAVRRTAGLAGRVDTGGTLDVDAAMTDAEARCAAS